MAARSKAYDAALQEASGRGHIPVVLALLGAAADPEARGADGAPPLLSAAEAGHARS